ncbi:MAG: hydrolase [Actinobacteria bacterium 13_2_20CM_2_71_6]|nr:MAG: hydrolase [Actinobacteria bacterium 13_2_20CM_2_71_6]
MAHLVWDWNGTLLDDLPLVVAATNACLASCGGVPVTAEEHRRDFRRPIAAYYAFALGRAVGDDEFVTLDRIFHDAYGAGLASCALTVDALTALTSWPGTQSLLSMWFHDKLVPTIDRYGLAGYFARVDGLRATVGGGSKTPHLIAHLDALGLAGTDCVLIGDSVDDAEAAEAVGASCVLYAGGFTDAGRLAATGRPVAHTLTEAVSLAAAQARVPTAAPRH